MGTCSSSCNQAIALEAHVNGKNHAKKTTAEDPNIGSKLAQYAKLEVSHREAKKQQAAGGETFMAKMFAFRASMTKEQLKEYEKDKKRKRAEEGTVPSKKKKPTVVPYKCGCCEKELEPHVVPSHMEGGGHFKKVKQFDGGCWLCHVPAPAPAEHFEGKKHMSHMKRLAELGVPEEAIYAMTQAAAMEVASTTPQVNSTNGTSKKAKKKGAPNAGGAMSIAQMAALVGLGQGKSSKAKKKANKSDRPKELKGDPNDMTCWDFKNGKCRKGDKCKWEHA